MLLSACVSPTETTATQVILKLPPPGLFEPCYKPDVIGTWPEVVTDDIPNLKAALKDCAKQPEDYFMWRAKHEKSKELQHD